MSKKKLEESDRTGGSGNFGGDSNFTANSPLDSGEMINPLLDILDNLILFYMIEFILILVIIYFILNKILKNKIGLILVKYVPSKYKKIHNIISKVNDTSGRIDSIFVLIFLFISLLIKFMGIYVTTEIRINIDDLVYLYNQTKKIVV